MKAKIYFLTHGIAATSKIEGLLRLSLHSKATTNILRSEGVF